MRNRGVCILLFVLVAGGVALLIWAGLRVVAPVAASARPDGILLANPGFAMRAVSIEVSSGGRSITLRRESLPRGETLLPLSDLPDGLRSPDAVSVSGTRLGLGWTSHNTLRFTAATTDIQAK